MRILRYAVILFGAGWALPLFASTPEPGGARQFMPLVNAASAQQERPAKFFPLPSRAPMVTGYLRREKPGGPAQGMAGAQAGQGMSEEKAKLLLSIFSEGE